MLAAGILGAANGVANGIDKSQLTAAEVSKLTGDVNAYQQAGILTSDAAQQFLNGNLAKKREIASQGAAAFALQQQAQENQFKQQRLDQEGQRITAEDFTPSLDTLTAAGANGYIWAQQSKHGGTYLKKQDAPGVGAPSETALPESGATVVDLGNGKRALVRPAAEKPLNSGDAMMLGTWQTQLGNINNELNEHTSAIAQGDNRYGAFNVHSREERVKELQSQQGGLQAKINALTQGRSAAATPTATAGTDKGVLPPGGGAAPATQVSPTPGAMPQQQAAGGATTGYQPGTRYKRGDGSWITYMGGDPANAASWK